MKRLMMGIDLGAGGVKVSIIDDEGVTVSSGSSPIETYMPRPGWVEQEPAEWWTAACAAIREAVTSSKIDIGEIAAIGVSGGAHIGVLTDDRGARSDGRSCGATRGVSTRPLSSGTKPTQESSSSR